MFKGYLDSKNYYTYKKKCEDFSIVPIDPAVYAFDVGILECAKVMFPESSEQDQILKYKELYLPKQEIPTEPIISCGSCGGGELR